MKGRVRLRRRSGRTFTWLGRVASRPVRSHPTPLLQQKFDFFSRAMAIFNPATLSGGQEQLAYVL